MDTIGPSLASVPDCGPSTSDYLNGVVAAVRLEINGLESPRPGLVAAAMSMAAILDNPRATSSKPPAAGRLMQVLDELHSSSPKRRGKLAVVRGMTNEKT